MDGNAKLLITVANEQNSIRKTLAEFDKITEKSIRAKSAAEGIGAAFTYTAAEIQAAHTQLKAFVALTKMSWAIPAGPFKIINLELQKAIVNAKLLRTILSAPLKAIPQAYMQSYRELGKISQAAAATPLLMAPAQSRISNELNQRLAAFESRQKDYFAKNPPLLIEDTRAQRAAAEAAQNAAIQQWSQRHRTAYLGSAGYTQPRAIVPAIEDKRWRNQMVLEDKKYREMFSRPLLGMTQERYAGFGKISEKAVGGTGFTMFPGAVDETKRLTDEIIGAQKAATELGQRGRVAGRMWLDDWRGTQQVIKQGKEEFRAATEMWKERFAERKKTAQAAKNTAKAEVDSQKQIASGHDMLAQKDIERSEIRKRLAQSMAGYQQRESDSIKRQEAAAKKETNALNKKEETVKRTTRAQQVANEMASRMNLQQAAESTNISKKEKERLNTAAAHKKAQDELDKKTQAYNKTQKQTIENQNKTAKNQSFINSRFGQFSIIMSGLAATLFVWQNIVNIIRKVVGVGIELEQTFINIADKVELSTNQLEALERQARAAGKTGLIKAPDFANIIAGYVELGVSIEDATLMMQQIIEHQKDLFDDTTIGRLKQTAGLFRELAARGFEFSQGGLNSMLDGLNKSLKEIADSASGWEFLARSIDGVHKALSKLNVVFRSARWWVNLIWVKTGAVDALKVAWDKASESLQEYIKFQSNIGTGIYDPQIYQQGIKSIQPQQPQPSKLIEVGGYEDFDALNTSIYDVAESSEVAERSVDRFAQMLTYMRKSAEDAQSQLKKLPSDLKKAASEFGMITEQMRKAQVLEIDRFLENLRTSGIITPEQLGEMRNILTQQFDLSQQKPAVDIFKQQFDKFGIITKEYYDYVSAQRENALKQDLFKLREYAKKFGLEFKDIEVTPRINFKVVAEDFDLQGEIQKAADQFKLDPKLIQAVMKQESDFDPYAVSKKGAMGLMQLTPDTAEDLGVDPLNIKENIYGGAKYLKQMLDMFGGDLRLALAAYNAGPKAVREAGMQVPPYKETEDFVKRILANLEKQLKIELNITGPAAVGGAGRLGESYQIESLMHLKDKLAEAPPISLQDIFDQAAFSQYQSDISKTMGFLRDYYEQTGKMSEDYFKNELAKLEFNRIQMTKALESIGVADAQIVAQRIFDRKKSLLVWDKIYADEVGITKDAITALEKLFDETGYYDPRLADVAELKFQQRMKRVLASFKIAPHVSPYSAYFAPDLFESEEDFTKYREILDVSQSKEALKKLDNERKMALEGWQAYYEATGNMSAAHVASEKERIDAIIKILADQNVDITKLAKIRSELLYQLDKKSFSGRTKDYQEFYSTTGKMTYEHYQQQIKEAKHGAEQIREAIGGVLGDRAAEEYFNRVEAGVQAKFYKGSEYFSDGVKLRLAEVRLAVESNAEKMRDVITDVVQGTRRIASDTLFDTMKAEFDSLEDLFQSLGDSFAQMLNRMAADILAAELGKLLFGELAGGQGALSPGFLTGETGWIGAGVNWLSTLFGGGTTPTGMTAASINPFLQAVKAKGGAFGKSGEINRFASGGVFNSPTYFPFADGIGMLGEAGPEAIMPLARTPSGELGVKSQGKGTVNNFNIVVQAPDGRIPRQSMNQLTSQLGRTVQNSMRRNS